MILYYIIWYDIILYYIIYNIYIIFFPLPRLTTILGIQNDWWPEKVWWMNIQMEELSTAKAKALAVDRWVAADSTGITSPRIFLKPVGGSGIYYDLLRTSKKQTENKQKMMEKQPEIYRNGQHLLRPTTEVQHLPRLVLDKAWSHWFLRNCTDHWWFQWKNISGSHFYLIFLNLPSVMYSTVFFLYTIIYYYIILYVCITIQPAIPRARRRRVWRFWLLHWSSMVRGPGPGPWWAQ